MITISVTDHAVIIFVALFASTLTLFSDFGLGTLLMPAFAFFFPIELAIAMAIGVTVATGFIP